MNAPLGRRKRKWRVVVLYPIFTNKRLTIEKRRRKKTYSVISQVGTALFVSIYSFSSFIDFNLKYVNLGQGLLFNKIFKSIHILWCQKLEYWDSNYRTNKVKCLIKFNPNLIPIVVPLIMVFHEVRNHGICPLTHCFFMVSYSYRSKEKFWLGCLSGNLGELR